MTVSIGELIDRLTIVNLKIFYCVDLIEHSPHERIVAENAKKAQLLNKERSRLINEINRVMGSDRVEVKV